MATEKQREDAGAYMGDLISELTELQDKIVAGEVTTREEIDNTVTDALRLLQGVWDELGIES